MKQWEKPLRQVILEHILLVLEKNGFHRNNTADALGISVKGLRNYLREIADRGMGVVVDNVLCIPKNRMVEENNLICSDMASNHQRISHLNRPMRREPKNLDRYESYLIDGELIYKEIDARN